MPKKKVSQDPIEEIKKRFGKDALLDFSKSNPLVQLGVVPTGLISFDIATGVMGMPKGIQVETFGPESSNKSSLGMHLGGQFLKYDDRKIAIIDAECAFDPSFAKTFGIDVHSCDVSRIDVQQPDSAEQALQTMELMIKSGDYSYIMTDSVAALTPMSVLTSETGDKKYPELPKFLSEVCPQFARSTRKHACTLNWINQLRQNIGVIFGDDTKTPGGWALKFYSHMRLRCFPAKGSNIKFTQTGDIVGKKIKCTIVKNKCGAPFRNCIIDHIFGDGFQTEKDLVRVGLEKRVLKKGKSSKINKECIFFGKKNLGVFDANLTKLNRDKINSLSDSIMEEIYAKVQ